MIGWLVRGVAPVVMFGVAGLGCLVPTTTAGETEGSDQASTGRGGGASAAGDAGAGTAPKSPDADGPATLDGGAEPKVGAVEGPQVAFGETWIAEMNLFRRTAKLPALVEDVTLNPGALAHSRYMVRMDVVAHDQDPKSASYSSAGAESAKNSNVLGSPKAGRADTTLDDFMRTPFHALEILNPKLVKSGFGEFTEYGPGIVYAATLDVRRGVSNATLPASTYPVLYPANTAVMPLTSSVPEYPDPLAACAGYSHPAGAPILVLLKPGVDSDDLDAHTLTRDGQEAEHCVVTASSYVNKSDLAAQGLGRSLLKASNAVIVIPRAPLARGASYAVSLKVDDAKLAWSFRVAANAR